MTTVYKKTAKNELQYLANKLHMTTGETMAKYNKSNIKLPQVPINKKKTQGDRRFSFIGPYF